MGAPARRLTAGALRIAAALALGALAGCATGPAVQPAAPHAAPFPFVDAHVHLNDVALQLDLMAANGIPRAVVFWGRSGDNATVLAAARAHPDRFVPFASVSPERREYRDLWAREDPRVVARLDEMLRGGGFRGIGEISVVHFPSPGFPEADFRLDGPVMAGIMALARRDRLPVLIHCEITRIREMEALLAANEDVAVIWAHGGYTPYFLARRLIERHPNLTYELSARTWRRHPRSPDYTIFMTDDTLWPEWRQLIEDHPTRFVVGTDAANRSRASDQARIDSVHALLAQLSEPTRRAVASDNLMRLLGLR